MLKFSGFADLTSCLGGAFAKRESRWGSLELHEKARSNPEATPAGSPGTTRGSASTTRDAPSARGPARGRTEFHASAGSTDPPRGVVTTAADTQALTGARGSYATAAAN